MCRSLQKDRDVVRRLHKDQPVYDAHRETAVVTQRHFAQLGDQARRRGRGTDA